MEQVTERSEEGAKERSDLATLWTLFLVDVIWMLLGRMRH